MKRVKRVVVCLTLLGILFGMTPSQAYACNKTMNCYSNDVSLQCYKPEIYEFTYDHRVTDPNGYTTGCYITTLEGTHKQFCAGCGADFNTTTWERCFEEHSYQYCFDRYFICGSCDCVN